MRRPVTLPNESERLSALSDRRRKPAAQPGAGGADRRAHVRQRRTRSAGRRQLRRGAGPLYAQEALEWVGYTSLSLLMTCPLNRIKIDRSFVIGMLETRQDLSVIRAILDMARSFDLETIAEGIETCAQRDRLRTECCTEGQGYLFAKPMPSLQFEQLYGIGVRQAGSA